jgi:hypothetical protein
MRVSRGLQGRDCTGIRVLLVPLCRLAALLQTLAPAPRPADYLHPGGLGQKIMADLGALLIQETVLDLLLYPWSQQDQAMLEEPLPPPMYPGGWAGAVSAGRHPGRLPWAGNCNCASARCRQLGDDQQAVSAQRRLQGCSGGGRRL